MELLNQDSPEITRLLKSLDRVESRLSAMILESVKEDWLTNKQICEKLSISQRTLQSYREQHGLQFSRVGDKFFYSKNDLETFLRQYLQKNF